MTPADTVIHALARGVAQATIEMVHEAVREGTSIEQLYRNRDANARAMADITLACAEDDPTSEVHELRRLAGGGGVGELTDARRALVLDVLYRDAEDSSRELLADIQALSLPGHRCETIADFGRYMNDIGQEHPGQRAWTIGRLTKPIEGFEHERWCFHIRTPLKPEIVFGFNEADLNYMVATVYAALGYHTSQTWVEAIAASARGAAGNKPAATGGLDPNGHRPGRAL